MVFLEWRNLKFLVEDWDMFENLVDHVYKRHIRSDSSLHPVLMSEASVSGNLTLFHHCDNYDIDKPFIVNAHSLFSA